MAIDLAVVTLQRDSGIPEDAVQNNFVFDSGVGDFLTPEFMTLVSAAITELYTLGDNLSQYLASVIAAPGAHTIEHYNITTQLAGGAHGSPVRIDPLVLASTGTGTSVSEVAAVLTYRADYGTAVEFGAGGTRPRARRRGRLYFGPLASSAFGLDPSTGESVVSVGLRSALAQAGENLSNHSAQWCVWSRVSAAVFPVVAGWVDNAFDVQRRRGVASTARTNWP